MRLAALLLFTLAYAHACDCFDPGVRAKRRQSDVVFRGTIVEVRESAKGTESNAVFRVSRVWKGQVGATFEMPAFKEGAACIGFWPPFLKVGADLLVYAQRLGQPSAAYFTQICGYHMPAQQAKKDFQKLGRGKASSRNM